MHGVGPARQRQRHRRAHFLPQTTTSGTAAGGGCGDLLEAQQPVVEAAEPGGVHAGRIVVRCVFKLMFLVILDGWRRVLVELGCVLCLSLLPTWVVRLQEEGQGLLDGRGEEAAAAGEQQGRNQGARRALSFERKSKGLVCQTPTYTHIYIRTYT